jgi:hypothetical protein
MFLEQSVTHVPGPYVITNIFLMLTSLILLCHIARQIENQSSPTERLA